MKITKDTRDLMMFLMTQPLDTKWDLQEHKEKRSRSQNSYY